MMRGYVDPFEHRLRNEASEPEGEDASPEAHPDDGVVDGLVAIEEDLVFGRREAPFADDPANRVRAVGD